MNEIKSLLTWSLHSSAGESSTGNQHLNLRVVSLYLITPLLYVLHLHG